MPERTYKIIEIVGVSEKSVQQAIRNGIARAGETIREMDWFEVSSIRGLIKGGEVEAFQVSIKIGFRIMAPEELQG